MGASLLALAKSIYYAGFYCILYALSASTNKIKLFSCSPKVDHVIKPCKEPIGSPPPSPPSCYLVFILPMKPYGQSTSAHSTAPNGNERATLFHEVRNLTST